MGRSRRALTREFKREAVKLVTESGHSTARVARDLGLTPNLLRRWKQDVPDPGRLAVGLLCLGRST
ncbi:MAG: transposase [Nitrospiraceae bacterium]